MANNNNIGLPDMHYNVLADGNVLRVRVCC